MIHLLPTPKSCREERERKLLFAPAILSEHSEFSKDIPTFAGFVQKLFRLELALGPGGFVLRLDASLAADAYVIDTTGDAFVICASAREGLLYGLASALQLVTVQAGGLCAPSAVLSDAPDKEYRSLMLDLSREWHPMEQVLKFVDLCFLYKVNYLHLHFIDDQRYTLPSKVFPKLPTEGESYTAEEIAQLNDYAYERGIHLVPEFECPGHARSMTTKYSELFANRSDGDDGDFYTELGEKISADSLLCAGSAEAFRATTALLTELSEMFPRSEYLHIGGDEAKIALWEQCAHCRRYMEEHNIDGVYDLYSEYVARITDHVLSLGKRPMVWEGFPKLGAERISRDVVVIAWESHYHLVTDLLEEGFTVVNASWQPLYVVSSMSRRWSPLDILHWNVYNWQHWWEHSAATLNPITVPQTEQVMGSILCSWESTYEQEVARVMENLIAMNERVWNTHRTKSDADYLSDFKPLYRLAAHMMQ